jgi:hypothetical protein
VAGLPIVTKNVTKTFASAIKCDRAGKYAAMKLAPSQNAMSNSLAVKFGKLSTHVRAVVMSSVDEPIADTEDISAVQ